MYHFAGNSDKSVRIAGVTVPISELLNNDKDVYMVESSEKLSEKLPRYIFLYPFRWLFQTGKQTRWHILMRKTAAGFDGILSEYLKEYRKAGLQAKHYSDIDAFVLDYQAAH